MAITRHSVRRSLTRTARVSSHSPGTIGALGANSIASSRPRRGNLGSRGVESGTSYHFATWAQETVDHDGFLLTRSARTARPGAPWLPAAPSAPAWPRSLGRALIGPLGQRR